MYKKYLGSISLLAGIAALVLPVAVFAQSSSSLQPPQIQVSNITLSQPTVSQGDTVTGTFQMLNQGSSAASNIGYRVSLVGNYQPNTLAGTFYDTSVQQGSVYVPGKSSVSVPFTYTLPIAISGTGLGIQIQAFTAAGIPLGWSDDKLTVQAKQGIVLPPTLSLSSASLNLGTSTFPLQAGPVVHPGETPTLVIGLSSAPTTPTVVAHIDLYNRLISGTPLLSTTSTLTLTSKTKTFSITLPLPTTARVYDARVTLETTNGVTLAPPLEVYYIVAGDIITIQSLTSNVPSVTAGNKVILTLQYTGSPFDIRTGAVANQSTSTLSIVLSNELGTTIGTYSTPLDPTGDTIQAPITASANATAMTATATVTNNGKVIATYSTNLSPNVLAARAQALQQPSGTSPWFFIILAIVLLLVILVIYLILKKKKLPVTPLVILAVMVVSGATLFSGAGTARAQTINETTNYSPNTYMGPANDYSGNPYADVLTGMTLTNANGLLFPEPYGVPTMVPGSTFYMRGNLSAYSCANAMQEAYFSFLNPLGTTNPLWSQYTKDTTPTGDGNVLNNYQFSIPFTAPTIPGTYTIALSVVTDTYYGHSITNTANTELQYAVCLAGQTYNGSTCVTVAPALSSGNISALPNPCTIASGASTCSSTIFWNTTNTAASSVVFTTPQNQTPQTFSPTVTQSSGSPAPGISITPTTFMLEDSAGTILDSVMVSGTCASGSTWNGSTCAPGAPTGTISALPNPCTIAFEASTCSPIIFWNTQNTPTASVVFTTPQNQTPQTFSPTVTQSSGSPAPGISITPTTFTLKDSTGATLSSIVVSGTCVFGSAWNGSNCGPILKPSCSDTGAGTATVLFRNSIGDKLGPFSQSYQDAVNQIAITFKNNNMTMAPGQQFFVQGSVAALSCTNAEQDTSFFIINPYSLPGGKTLLSNEPNFFYNSPYGGNYYTYDVYGDLPSVNWEYSGGGYWAANWAMGLWINEHNGPNASLIWNLGIGYYYPSSDINLYSDYQTTAPVTTSVWNQDPYSFKYGVTATTPFTAPTTPGRYIIHLIVSTQNFFSNGEDYTGTAEADFVYTVVASSPTSSTCTLTLPTSCVISSGHSACGVYATWTTTNVSNSALVDGNNNILSQQTNQSSPGLQVQVTYPQTVFNLESLQTPGSTAGGTILDTQTASATCASGTSWVGGICAPPSSTPSASTNLTATTDACFTSPTTTGSITLNWTAPTTGTVTSYGIYSDSAGTQHIGTSTNTSFAVTGLTSGAPYDTFSVRSYNSSGYSAAVDQTSSADASSECPPTATISSIDPSTTGDCSGSLTWHITNMSTSDLDAKGATVNGVSNVGCKVTSTPNDPAWTGYITNSTPEPVQVNVGGTANISHTYTLMCTNSSGQSSLLSSETFTPTTCQSGGTSGTNSGNYFPY